MRARRPLPVVFAVLVAGVVTATRVSRAHAGTVADAAATAANAGAAESAIRHGVELRRQGKDQEALDEFRKAYAQVKSPRALAQIGLAEQALGRWVDAEADLEQAVANKSDAWIRKNAPILTGALDAIRRHLGSLDVIGPAGAELRVDGRVVGALPLARPARLPIGNLTLELRKQGFYVGTRPVSIVAGELTRESLDLQPLAAPPVPAMIPGPPAEKKAALPPLVSSAGGDDAPEGDRRPGPFPGRDNRESGPATDDHAGSGGWHRALAWTTAVAGLLGVAAGTGALLFRAGKVDDANKLQCNVMSNGTVMPVIPANRGRCVDLANSADQARVAALISFSAAAALAIASTVLFVTLPPRAPPGGHTTASRLICAPTPIAAAAMTGVGCQLRF